METEKIEPKQEQIEITKPKKVISEKQKAGLERARKAKLMKSKEVKKQNSPSKITMPKLELPKIDAETRNKFFFVSLGIGGIVCLAYLSKNALLQPAVAQQQQQVQHVQNYSPPSAPSQEPVQVSRLRLDF